MQRLSLDTSVLRVRELSAMRDFCREVLQLPLLLETAASVTFELGSDARGHTQVLMLLADAEADAPRHLTLEVSRDDFPATCRHLRTKGALLFQSENSSAPGCAWRILTCQAPEGHRLIVVGIDPERCMPTSALPFVMGGN